MASSNIPCPSDALFYFMFFLPSNSYFLSMFICFDVKFKDRVFFTEIYIWWIYLKSCRYLTKSEIPDTVGKSQSHINPLTSLSIFNLYLTENMVNHLADQTVKPFLLNYYFKEPHVNSKKLEWIEWNRDVHRKAESETFKGPLSSKGVIKSNKTRWAEIKKGNLLLVRLLPLFSKTS